MRIGTVTRRGQHCRPASTSPEPRVATDSQGPRLLPFDGLTDLDLLPTEGGGGLVVERRSDDPATIGPPSDGRRLYLVLDSSTAAIAVSDGGSTIIERGGFPEHFRARFPRRALSDWLTHPAGQLGSGGSRLWVTDQGGVALTTPGIARWDLSPADLADMRAKLPPHHGETP